MKRLTSILLVIVMSVAAPAFLTSCQEDAPEINYTMSVTVTNDFTKVVEAINNGTLKNEEAIRKLAESIDKMNADQQTKLQSVIDVLNAMNASLDTKLTALEAALKAQTLSLEDKLQLLEAAVNNNTLKLGEMTDRLAGVIDNMSGALSDKLEAVKGIIESTSVTTAGKLAALEAAVKAQTLSLADKLDLLKTAVNNLPDYSDKFDAVVKALNDMKAQIEALGNGQQAIADAIATMQKEITKLIAEVKSGNTAAAAALAQLIAKLDELKAAIGGGGGGGTTPANTEYVDLGLPSGLKWAKCNLGASKPTDYGDYYAWGEIEPNKDDWKIDNYKFWKHDRLIKYEVRPGDYTLEAIDAAYVKLGAPWRMPDRKDFEELEKYCTLDHHLIQQDGVSGWEVKGPNGNSIFLPAAGYLGREANAGIAACYWSRTREYNEVFQGASLNFEKGFAPTISWELRYYGASIRPVRP